MANWTNPDNVGFQLWNRSKVLARQRHTAALARALGAEMLDEPGVPRARIESLLQRVDEAQDRSEQLWRAQVDAANESRPGWVEEGQPAIVNNYGEDRELAARIRELARQHAASDSLDDLLTELRAIASSERPARNRARLVPDVAGGAPAIFALSPDE